MVLAAFLQEIRDQTTAIAVYTGIGCNHEGKVKIVIKLPKNTPFLTKSITLDDIEYKTSTDAQIMLQLKGEKEQLIFVECLIDLRAFSGVRVFSTFLSRQDLDIYALTPDLKYMGFQSISHHSMGRIKSIMLSRNPPSLEEEPATAPSLEEEPNVPFPLYDKYLDAIRKEEDKSHRVPEEYTLTRYHLFILMNQQIQQFVESTISDKYNSMYLPGYPFWIECPRFISGHSQKSIGVFGLRMGRTPQLLIRGKDSKAYYNSSHGGNPWRLVLVNEIGVPFLRLFLDSSSFSWKIDPSHVCPKHMCQTDLFADDTLDICYTCKKEADFWLYKIEALLALVFFEPDKSAHKLPSSGVTSIPVSSVSNSLNPSLFSEPIPSSSVPVILGNSGNLLIDRYIDVYKANRVREAIDQSQKFLWMHSAWQMTEVLRTSYREDEPLCLSTDHLYIELEQPRQIYNQDFAACSLLRLSDKEQMMQNWQLSVIDSKGIVSWTMFYEFYPATQKGNWTLSKTYLCPDRQCRTERTKMGSTFVLCASCQERVTYYASWLALALSMIAGDFQEQVEMREPEAALEVSTWQSKNETTGEITPKLILRRFRIIRYYDTCLRRDGKPQTKRGSWMAGRPLAKDEYEVNPNAIIYVRIRPREHDRTYRHNRYIHMKGKTQHIDPQSRLQPMTIATFRQLPRLQRITRVYASKFDE